MIVPGGIAIEGPDEDEAYDRARQRQIDDEAEAKRRASGFSPEQLSLQDARIEGSKAGQRGLSASLNPYQDTAPEHREWETHRLQALAQHLARQVA